jgi:Fe-S-cluster containining protein
MQVAIHFIDQKLVTPVDLSGEVAGLVVNAFIEWAFEHVQDQHVHDVIAAIRDGHVKWVRYTRSRNTTGTLHEVDGAKRIISSLVVPRRGKPAKIAGDIFFSAPYALPCKRCGACCMPKSSKQAFRKYLGDIPPTDNGYYIKSHGMLCRVKVPPGAEVLDLGVPSRCAHLKFDVVEGMYGCKIYDKPRQYACGAYECSFMQGELDRWEGSFQVVPAHPACDACIDHACHACYYLPLRVEWFIAYARHNEIATIDPEFINDMIRESTEYGKKLQTRDDEAVRACIDRDWLGGYLETLRELENSRSTSVLMDSAKKFSRNCSL